MAARRRLLPWAVLVAAKIVVSSFVWIDGFRAVSDDDYARVTLAQAWAIDPKIDPTGTSWLPLPFWLYGAVMAVFGRGLAVAQVTAWVLGLLSIFLVYDAARRILGDDGKALVAGLLAAVVPWCARLGVATVPELPVAALSLWAVAATVRSGAGSDGSSAGASPILAGAALGAACLSRYDPWPVAVGFAVVCGIDALRGRWSAGRAVGGAVLALAGPALWIAHNARTHGDAFAFAARVANYKRAVGGDDSSMLDGLLVYPVTLVTHEPELFAALVLAVIALVVTRRRAAVREIPWGRFSRPAALAALGVAALVLAAVRDGAPTHHPERAVLLVLLLAIVLGGDLFVRVGEAKPSRKTSLATLAALVVIGLAAIPFRIIFRVPGDFARREDEIAVGVMVAEKVPPGDKVLLEVVDYGYFAVMAGSGRPEAFVRDRSLDPREAEVGSSFGSEERLRKRVEETGVSWVVGRGSEVTERAGLARVEGPAPARSLSLFAVGP